MNILMKKLRIHYPTITNIFKVFILQIFMDSEDLKIIQQQVPDISFEKINQVYKACQQDVLETICQLLELAKPKKKVLTDWEERRDICDSHDREIQLLMNEMKQHGLQQISVENYPITRNPKLT